MDGFISSKLFFLDLDVRTPPLLKNPMMFKRQQFSTLPICDKSVQNLKSFWFSAQNYFVLALFCSLHS